VVWDPEGRASVVPDPPSLPLFRRHGQACMAMRGVGNGARNLLGGGVPTLPLLPLPPLLPTREKSEGEGKYQGEVHTTKIFEKKIEVKIWTEASKCGENSRRDKNWTKALSRFFPTHFIPVLTSPPPGMGGWGSGVYDPILRLPPPQPSTPNEINQRGSGVASPPPLSPPSSSKFDAFSYKPGQTHGQVRDPGPGPMGKRREKMGGGMRAYHVSGVPESEFLL